MRCGRHNT
ncbi:hypothetical protein ATI02_5694 [Pseudomonas baetica]|uniref:Uncharacterized protein n=1 Tax=Pseudomonas baetica TaxID=674054 RepID=A0ABX4Q750_9PSED|nr:hypothetical protein ATI02_5694 [Pseudomonas baetica]